VVSQSNHLEKKKKYNQQGFFCCYKNIWSTGSFYYYYFQPVAFEKPLSFERQIQNFWG